VDGLFLRPFLMASGLSGTHRAEKKKTTAGMATAVNIHLQATGCSRRRG
jgi:hypothetical protein